MLSRYEAGSGLDIRWFSPTLAVRRSRGWRRCLGMPFFFLADFSSVIQRASNPDFAGCFDFRGAATAVNDVQDLNPFRFDAVYDEISAMLRISVNTCFSRDGSRRKTAPYDQCKIKFSNLRSVEQFGQDYVDPGVVACVAEQGAWRAGFQMRAGLY